MFFRTEYRALLLTAALAVLHLIPYEQLTTLTIFILAGLLATPIAIYRLEYRLFARRAVITLGCPQDGLAKRWLWHGSLVKITNYVISLAIALLVIVVVSSLNNNEWLIVIAATGLLIVVEAMTMNFAKKHTRGNFAAISQRGLIKWPAIIFLIIASAALFINASYPAYAGQDIIALALQTFEGEVNKSSSPLLGYSRAILSTLDVVTMYFAQDIIPRIDDTATKWLLWLYFAVKSVIATGLIVYLMLGFLTLASIKERRGWKILGKTVFEKSFTLTLILLVVIYVYVSRIDIIPALDEKTVSNRDCTAAMSAVQSAQDSRLRVLGDEEKALSEDVTERINTDVDRIFASAESGVEKYLDWHFSVLGEYQQLGTQMVPKIEAGSAARLSRYVMNGLNTQLKAFSKKLDSQVLAKINESSQNGALQLPAYLPYGDCFPSLEFKPVMFKQNPVYVGHPQTLAGSTAIAAIIAKKTAAKVGAKGAGKVAGKYATSLATGLTVAGFCGPYAPICGAGAAIFTWVTVDAIIVTADELMNRDELRQDILRDLNTQKTKVKDQMILLNQEAISTSYDFIEKTFRVPEDGLKPTG